MGRAKGVHIGSCKRCPCAQESDWTTDCCAGLTDSILDQNSTVTVLSVASDLCIVEMSVAGRDVAQDLVRDGFAIASCHTPKSTTTGHQKDTLTIPSFFCHCRQRNGGVHHYLRLPKSALLPTVPTGRPISPTNREYPGTLQFRFSCCTQHQGCQYW